MCLTSSLIAQGQSDVLLTQQIFSRMNFNPAATGASNYTNVFFLNRVQWAGIDGAPKTQYFDLHKYIPTFSSGMGGTLVHDKVGLEDVLNIKLNYSYHVRLSEESYVSLGLSVGILNRSVSAEKIYEEDSPSNNYAAESKLTGDFDIGAEYAYKKWLFGASVTHIPNTPTTKPSLSAGDGLVSSRQMYAYTQYFGQAGNWKLSPALIMINSQNDFNIDGIFVATFREVAWGGASLRVDKQAKPNSISFLAGIYILKSLRFGYSYDVNIAGPGNVKNGSYEIMINWRFGGVQPYPARSPRFLE